MRKPSKLLSLFLAFVMVLTSLSAGLTAFAAQEDWKSSATYNGANGDPITENIHELAEALYGSDFGTAPLDGNRIKNLLSLGSSSPYYHHGTYIVDDAEGNGYKIVKNAFEINFKGNRNDVDDGGGKTIANALKDYMGEDFNSISQWDAAGPWFWPTVLGAYAGDWNDHVYKRTVLWSTTYYYKQSSVATVIELNPEYYLWNAYGDVLADLDDSGILPTVKTFYWKNANSGTGNGTQNGNSSNLHFQVDVDELDLDSDAILVNAEELKAFGTLFTDIWDAFGKGDFENVPSNTFVDILTDGMDLMKKVRDNNHTGVQFSGRKATPGNNSAENGPDQIGTTAVNKPLSTDANATKQIFQHFFPITAEGIDDTKDIYEQFSDLYNSFITWMIQRFKDAVNTIGESYTAGVINDGLTFEDFTDLKYNFTVAYDIWDAFPDALREEQEAAELKDKLDAYYYNGSDTKDNITSFVPAWNNANAQAYIDVTEKLEFASGENYIIKNDAELDRVKELLDAAEALYGDILWESSYENKPDGTPNYSDLGLLSNSLLFESEAGNDVQGGAEVVDHAKNVWDGAYKSYIEYIYRRFIKLASVNLDEYCKDTNGNGEIDADDDVPEITVSLGNMMVFRAKMDKVQSAYNELPEEVQQRALVQFYMSIVAKIDEAINGLPDWTKYNVESPYYYNWDEKKKEIDAKNDVKALLDGLNEFVGSPVVLDLLSDMLDADVDTSQGMGKFVRNLVEQLLYDNANSIFQAVMGMVFPMIQQALKDTYVDAASTDAYNLQRNGARVVLFNVHADILFSDPDMFNNTFPAASDVTKINGFKGYTQYTNDADIKIAADEIAKAKDNWDNVNWEKVDFKIDNLSEFCDVLGTILRMIDKLVNMVLFDEPAIATTDCSASKTADIDKHHTKGYEKDLIPMLEALGITGLPKYADAKKLATDQKWDELLEKVITAILDSVEKMLDKDPVSGILKLLPNLAYMLFWDKLTGPVIKGKGEYNGWINNGMPSDVSGIGDLLAPLTELAGLSLYGLAGIEHLDSNFVNEMIPSEISIGDTSIVLPEINWAAILGLGDMKYSDKDGIPTSRTDGQRKNIDGIPEDVILYLVEYLSELVSTNSEAIHDLIAGKLPEGNEKVAELFEKLYGNLINTASNPKAFGAVLLELVRTVEVEGYEWADFSTWEWNPSLVEYTGLPYTEKDVKDSIATLSAIAVNALNKFVFEAEDGDDVTLTDFISTKDILTGDVINSLFKTIYSLDSATMEMILKFVEVKDGSASNGIDVSLDNVIGLLADYPEVEAVLKAWAQNHKYFVDEVPSGEYEVTCNNKVDKEVDGETQEVDCGAKLIVTADSGTVTCEECGQGITYTADDAKVLTKTVSLFDDEEAITAEMWNVTDIKSFKDALVTILDPFKYIVGAALAGDGTTISVAGIINVVLDDGYQNVIKPLLSVFENETNFTLDDSVAADTALDQILTMLINLVDAIAADPVNIIISVLPQLAAFIDNNGIQNLIGYFIQPFWNVISAVLDLVQLNNDFVPKTDDNRIYDDSLFDTISGIFLDDNAKGVLTWENIQNNVFALINILLENIVTIGDEKYGIEIPAIDWADLAGSGTKGENSIKADKASVVVKILRYIWRVVVRNEATISALLTDKVGELWGQLNNYIAIENYSEDDFVYLVLTLINGLDSSDYNSTDVWDEILNAVYEPTTDVKYPVDENGNLYNEDDVMELVDFISGVAMTAVEEFVDGFEFSEIGGTIYSSAIPVLIAKNLLPLFESQKDIFKLLDIEYTYEDLIEALAAYTDVVDDITAQNVTALAEIDWTAIAEENKFGIENSAQFTAVVSILLAPVAPLFNFLFGAGEIRVLGVVPLIGAYGYQNALLPLFKTLGIDKFGAVDADTFNAQAEADPTSALANIITPLFAWVDNALGLGDDAEGPAGTLLSVLPDLAKFIDKGGLQQFIHDLLYPVVHLANTVLEILTHQDKNRDTALELVFEIAMDILNNGTEKDENLLDRILGLVFGARSKNDITWKNVHEHVFDLAALILNKVDIGATASVDKDGSLILGISVSGNPMTIVVPKYNLAKLAGIASIGTKKATDTLLVIVQYLWDGVLNNETTFDSVKSLLSNELGDIYNTKVPNTRFVIGDFIESFLSSEANELVAALIQMERALDSSDYDDSDRFYGANGIFTTMFDGYTELAATDYPGLKDTSKGKNDPDYYYNENDIKDILDTFNSLVNAVTSIIAGSDVENISANLLFNENIAGLVAKLVAQIADNSTLQLILPMLGVEFTKDSFAEKLAQYGYDDLADLVNAAESLSAIDWAEAASLFYIDDEDAFRANVNLTDLSGDNTAQFRFTRAITVILSPFSGLLNAFLNGGETMLANVLPFTGAPSYGNAIKPLLDAFGCDTVDLDEFAAQTEENTDYLLFNILNPILAQLDKFILDPANTLYASLPTLAAFIGNSGLEISIMNLLYPITELIHPLFRLALPDGLTEDNSKATIYNVALAILGFDFDFVDLHDHIFDIIANIVNGSSEVEIITIKANGDMVIQITVNGNKLPLVIPKYDLDAIAGCGVSDNETKRISDAFITIFRYFTEILRINADDFILPAIDSVIDDADIFAVVKDYISNVIKPKEKDAVLITLIRIIKNLETSGFVTDERWQEIGKLKDGVADVEYPAPQTLETITTAIKTLSETAIAAVNVFAGIDLTTLTADKFYSTSGSLISTLASLIFSLGDDNTVKQILGFIGVDLAKDSIEEYLTERDYAKIASAIAAADTMSAVDFDALADAWNIADAEDFTRALVAVLSPFAELIGVLLLPDSKISIADGTFELDGAFGYRNAIKPLLEALGADPVNSDEYVEMAKADSDNILFNIIYPLLAKIDSFAADPVGELLLTLPSIVNYLKDGGLQLTIQNLLYPIVNPLDPIVRLVTGDMKGENEIKPEEIYDIVVDIFLGDKADKFSWSNIHEQIYDVAAVIINKYISDPEDPTSISAKVNKDGSLTINNIYKLADGNTVSIKLPNIMDICDKIANCGNALDLTEYGSGYVTGDKTPDEIKANTFVALIEILWDIADINENAVKSVVQSLVGNSTYDSIKKYVNKLFTNEGGDIVNAVVAVINSVDASGYDSSSLWKALLAQTFKPTVAKYPEGYNASDINFVIDTVSEVLTKALDEFANLQLSELAKGYVYKDSYVSAIAKIILGLGEDGTVADILKFVGIDLSKDAIADMLQAAGYSDAAKAIRAAENADAIDWSKISWKANSADGFAKALATVISPLEPVLAYILTAGEINISDVLTIKGANGYDNAVKHLLEEAFGCTGLKASSAYANVTELMTAVFKAVFDKIDSILASDNIIGTVLDAIPQLSAFIARGGVQQFVEDLLYPITSFVNPIVALVFDGEVFDFALDLLKNLGVIDFDLKWKTVHNNLIDIANTFLNFTVKGADITITLNKNLTWAKLAGCATRPDTLLTILSYIWENVQGNKSSIETLLKALLGEDTFANVSEYVNNFLSNADKDIVKAIVQVCRGIDASSHKADWSFLFKNYKKTTVKYPEGITSADLEEIVEILTVAIENALEIFLDTTLPTLAGDLVYTDSIINSVKDIVNSLAKNETVKSVFGILGLEINVNNKTYKVTDKASFAAALADVLKPFEPILNAFLNKGDITIADVITLTGADGFNNAVKPLLEYALGCKNVTDRSLKGIITAVLDRVEEILANPVEELIDLVPMISNFIGKGGVQYFVEELLYPVINIADAIVSLVTKDSVFDFAFKLLGIDITWANAQNEIVPLANSMLKNVTINGKSYSITIPSIDWLKIGGCGKLSGTSIRANQGDVIMTLLEYIFKALEANKGIIYDLVGDNGTIKEIITNILNQGAFGMVRIVVRILLKMQTFDNVEWFFKNIKHVETTYTPNYGEEDYAEFVEEIDDAIFGLLASFVQNLNVATLLNDMVYKNSIVNSVAKLVYTNLEKISVAGISIHKILKALDLDITTATVANMLKDYSSASAEIGKHGAWSEVNFDAINWNFTDGDKTGFINALSAALRPIQPLIRVILSGEDLIVLGSIHIKGGNGYNTTVIPLLEALGVDAETLVSPQQYSKEADTDKVLTSILTPVLDLAETLLNKPIFTLCNMLPNVAYFLLNGGAQAIVENIAGPVFNLLEEVAPIYDLNVDKLLKDSIGFGISDLGDLDLDDLVNTLLASIEIKGQKLTIRITDIDLETLAGRGELVQYTSARTYDGKQMVCKKIVADAPAVFVSVLRYIIENLKANLDAIKDLLAGLGLSGNVADMVQMILGFLTDLDTDMVIEELLALLFGGSDGETETNGTAPYEVRDLSWLHWTIVGCSTLFMLLIFLAVLGKKKKEEEPENAEVAAQE